MAKKKNKRYPLESIMVDGVKYTTFRWFEHMANMKKADEFMCVFTKKKVLIEAGILHVVGWRECYTQYLRDGTNVGTMRKAFKQYEKDNNIFKRIYIYFTAKETWHNGAIRETESR